MSQKTKKDKKDKIDEILEENPLFFTWIFFFKKKKWFILPI